MEIEIDTRIESAKFVVDGTALDIQSIQSEPSIEWESGLPFLKVTTTFYADKVVTTGRDGVTTTMTADGTISLAGEDSAAIRRAAARIRGYDSERELVEDEVDAEVARRLGKQP